jgi:hypothetical protein
VNIGAGAFAVKGYFDTRLPGQSYFGAEPVALAMDGDGSRLYVANMASNAVAVLDTRKLTPQAVKAGMVEPDGFFPTEWMPISMAFVGVPAASCIWQREKAKAPDRTTFPSGSRRARTFAEWVTPSSYIPSLLYGSLATIDEHEMMMKAAEEKIAFAGDAGHRSSTSSTSSRRIAPTIRSRRPEAGTESRWATAIPSLTMYGEAITPNLHKLALQFGVLDNFFDSGEVSGDGHVWSTAAIGTDYLEKTWQQNYRGAADLRLRRRGGRGLSAAAEDSRRQRAGERLSVGQSGGARQELLPLRRVHFHDVLQ